MLDGMKEGRRPRKEGSRWIDVDVDGESGRRGRKKKKMGT